MLEKEIETYLVKRVKAIGGRSIKLTAAAYRSLPDRMCLFPGGIIIFVECKRPGKKPTTRQQHEINLLKALGFTAVWVDTKNKIDALIKYVEIRI